MTKAERFENIFQDYQAAKAAGLKYDFEAARKRDRIAAIEEEKKFDIKKIFTVQGAKRYVEEQERIREAKSKAQALVKAEEKKILEEHPQIGIFYRWNPNWKTTGAVQETVYYIHGCDLPEVESTDLSVVLEAIKRG